MSLLSFRITLPPHPVPPFSCVKVTVLLRKCQTGALSPLSGHHGCQVAVVSNKPFTVSAPSSSHARTTSLSAECAAQPNVSDVCCIYFVFFSPSPATIAAISAQCKSIYHRGDKRSICSGYKKHKLFIILRDPYKSILACECAMHHCRYPVGPCSHRFSSCLSKCVCVQSGCAASCMQTTFSHVTEDTQGCVVCLHENDGPQKSERWGSASLPVGPARHPMFALNKVTICRVGMQNTENP